jgi:hypothetical protein
MSIVLSGSCINNNRITNRGVRENNAMYDAVLLIY